VAIFNGFADSYDINPALHYLHKAGWVHRDLGPGNVIVVGTEAKISDLEFAERWAGNQLEELTRPKGASLPVAKCTPVVGLSLADLTN